MSKNAPRLDSGLIARKGEASPTMVTRSEPVAAAPEPAAPEPRANVNQTGVLVPKGLDGTIAVTVRLDPDRYQRLKLHGAKQRQTNQQILVAALDAYL